MTKRSSSYKVQSVLVSEIANPNLMCEVRVLNVENYVSLIASSVEEFGQVNPIELTRSKEVKNGGGCYLLEAMRRLGYHKVRAVVDN